MCRVGGVSLLPGCVPCPRACMLCRPASVFFFSAVTKLLNIASLSSLNAILPHGYPVQKTCQRAMKDCGGKGEN